VTVAKEPDRRGEHEGNRKTIARGMPGDSGVTVVNYVHTFCRGASAPGIPLRPLIKRVRKFDSNLGRHAPRDREAAFCTERYLKIEFQQLIAHARHTLNRHHPRKRVMQYSRDGSDNR